MATRSLRCCADIPSAFCVTTEWPQWCAREHNRRSTHTHIHTLTVCYAVHSCLVCATRDHFATPLWNRPRLIHINFPRASFIPTVGASWLNRILRNLMWKLLKGQLLSMLLYGHTLFVIVIWHGIIIIISTERSISIGLQCTINHFSHCAALFHSSFEWKDMASSGSSEITGMNINAVSLRIPRPFHNIFGSYFPAENLNGGENKPSPHGWLSFLRQSHVVSLQLTM